MDSKNEMIALIVADAPIPAAQTLGYWEERDRVARAWDGLTSREDLVALYIALQALYGELSAKYLAAHGVKWESDQSLSGGADYRSLSSLNELTWFGHGEVWESTFWPQGRGITSHTELLDRAQRLLHRYEGPRVDRAAGHHATRDLLRGTCSEYKTDLGRYLFTAMGGTYKDRSSLTDDHALLVAEHALSRARSTPGWRETPCSCKACGGGAVGRYSNTNESWLYPLEVAERAGWFNPYAV